MLNNSRLKNLFKLGMKVTVYVPSTVDINKPIDNTEYVNNVATKLSNWFGGATATDAVGCWVSPTAGLVREKTTLVFAYCNQTDLENHIDELIDLCEDLKKKMSQDSIALELNGEMNFI